MKKWIYYMLLGQTLVTIVGCIISWISFGINEQEYHWVWDVNWLHYTYLIQVDIRLPELLTILTLVLVVNLSWCRYCWKQSVTKSS